MDPPLSSMSPVRQTAIISAIAALLSVTFTGAVYFLFFGIDERFWPALNMAILIPWAITVPLGFYMSKQRFKFFRLTAMLKEARINLRQANKELELRANFDGMTGLLNRDHFFRRVDQMRKDQLANVLMIVDVDHFKYINDCFGHPIGDDALILLSKRFRRILRQNDLIGRIGGEEFGVFLPDTSVPEGQIIGEMIRHEIENTIFEPHHNMRHVITVSIGVTGVAPHQERSSIMVNADTALFTAKRSGRNRVVLFEPGMRSKPRPIHEKPQNMEVAESNPKFRLLGN